MASTTTSATPTTIERSASSRRHQHPNPNQSTPSRSQSTRTRGNVPPSPHRPSSTHRTSSRHGTVDEVLPQANYETSNVARQSRRSSSKDRPLPSSSEPQRTPTGHRRHHSRQTSEMTTAVANGGGPAPVIAPMESRHAGRSSKSRTTIPAPTGNWVLGKTIGAGSMGKVKLARRVEGGEQVCRVWVYNSLATSTNHYSRLPVKLSREDPPMMDITKVELIGNELIIQRRCGLHEKLLL